MTRKKEEFRPLENGKVKIYTCGPTVYNFAHLGNFRTYVFQDILRRWLEYRGYQVYQVMNITDVDDKTIRDSQIQGIPLEEFTEKYVKAFFEDIDKLNIKRATVYPRATAHIKEIVDLVKKLMEKKYAYKGDDGSVYFEISKFKDYGKLSKLKIDKLQAGTRVKADDYTKEEARDFALWKAWDEKDGNVFWDTELGRGRPGWHIECSAMSMKYLGETFDIHSGGVDLIFPHHENEIAQSEAATGKKFVNYWVHCEHLLVEGKKMSKSLGNFYTLRDLLERGFSPKAIRYVLLLAHYRRQLNFTFKELETAENTVKGLIDFVNRLNDLSKRDSIVENNEEIRQLVTETREKFEQAMDDDLNVNMALLSIFRLVRLVNKLILKNKVSKENAREIYELIMNFDKVLGIVGEVDLEEKLPSEIEDLILKREEARKRKDWKTADEIRRKLKEIGLELEDTPQGVRWKRNR
jgi:cysteinyl-tRNA synthetase